MISEFNEARPTVTVSANITQIRWHIVKDPSSSEFRNAATNVMDQHQQEENTSSPHLRRVLKSYQMVSMDSLSGPASCSSAWNNMSPPDKKSPNHSDKSIMKPQASGTTYNEELEQMQQIAAIPYPVQSFPVLFQPDQSRSDRQLTLLENELISCFVVGGEKRLCLPQVLNSVLREFKLEQIYSVCDELHIFCSRCNPEQLEILKLSGILPFSAASCGLITKTDAERLCNSLLHKAVPKSTCTVTKHSFQVFHKCFGRCKGIFSPELYDSPDAKCITCCHCHGLLSPQQFVIHSHKPLENRTCHWGFDSSNWRWYIQLATDQEDFEKLKPELEKMKEKFDVDTRKRRQGLVDQEVKRVRLEEPYGYNLWYGPGFFDRLSSFPFWQTMKDGKLQENSSGVVENRESQQYLNQGPDRLANHDSTVHASGISCFDVRIHPNVAAKSNPASPPVASQSEPMISASSLDAKPRSEGKLNQRLHEKMLTPKKRAFPMAGDVQLLPAMKQKDDEHDEIHEVHQALDRICKVSGGPVMSQEHNVNDVTCVNLTQEKKLQQALAEQKRLEKEIVRLKEASVKSYREKCEDTNSSECVKRNMRSDDCVSLSSIYSLNEHLRLENQELRQQNRRLEFQLAQALTELSELRKEFYKLTGMDRLHCMS